MQDYTMYIYKTDRRCKTSERLYSTTVWTGRDQAGMQREVEELHLHHSTHRFGTGFAGLVDREHVRNAGHGQVGVEFLNAAGCHQDEAFHFLWVRQRMTERDRAAQRVAQQRKALQAQRIDEALETVDKKVEVVHRHIGLAAESEAEQVRNDGTKAGLGENRVVGLEVAVSAGTGAGAVQEDDGRPASQLVVVQLLAVAYVGEVPNRY